MQADTQTTAARGDLRLAGASSSYEFISKDALKEEYPDAVSIEIRISDKSEYDAAIEFYKKDIGITIPSDSNDYSRSWAFPHPKNPNSIEILVINTSKAPVKNPPRKLENGIIGFIRWPNITTNAGMVSAYDCAIKTGAYREEEKPGNGIKGPRDITTGSKKTVRAILKKNRRPEIKKLRNSKEYDGVIINPPVP